MNDPRIAVLDLGTNTFNLLIAEANPSGFDILYQTQIGVRIGQGGISQGLITPEAQNRLFQAIAHFHRNLELYKVPSHLVWGVATSAFRHAKNAPEILDKIKAETGIEVEVISGEQEAGYIYEGVRTALDIGESNALIIDIGGGSVEFIICNQKKIFWKKSFEIGGQRLMDQYMRSDPISELDIQRLEIYLESQLLDLSNRVFTYTPHVLIGSAGAFDTLAEMAYRQEHGEEGIQAFIDEFHHLKVKEYALNLDEFHFLYQEIVRHDRDYRLALPGMIELRADMIVVAMCLLKFILEKYELAEIRVSSFALKEGYLAEKLKQWQSQNPG